MPGTTLARLQLLAERSYLAVALDFVRSLLATRKLTPADIDRLALVTEEACLNVIEHAFDPGETGSFDLEVLSRPGQIVIAVEDRGLPFDFAKAAARQEAGLGMRLMRAFADEVRFLSLGTGGKRVEFIKQLPAQGIAETTDQNELPSIPQDVEISYRLMRAEDAVAVSRCVYRSYGYTYATDFIYYPELVRERLEKGLVESVVAVAGQEIVGHLALVYIEPGDKVADSCMAVVDPRFRGHGIFKNLKSYLLEHARAKGMYGVYSEAVAVHPYTQKGNLSLGAHETGVLIGKLPTTMYFRKIYDEEKRQRQSDILFYLQLNEPPVRTVYLPVHHKSIISRIYEEGGLKRDVRGPADVKQHLPAQSEVVVNAMHASGVGFMLVRSIGQNLPDLVRYHLRELCKQQMQVVFLDLPLTDPGAASTTAALEMLGFFFSGVIPELYHGDMLRLQYLNNIEPDLEKVTRVSPFCNELFDYIVNGYEKELSL